jgi:hypothetical protein
MTLIREFQSATAFLIGERWIRWNFVEDRSFDDRGAVTRRIARSIKQLERLASRAAGYRFLP